MKKNVFITFLLFISLFAFLNADNINYNPAQIYIGTQVNFTLQGGGMGSGSTYTWTFGDSTPSVSGQNQSVTHSFKEPGNYTVKCEREAGNSGNKVETTVNITVDDRRKVNVLGSNFMAGSEISFETEHFVESNLNWDFGDGSVSNGPGNRKHTYQNQGNYTVKVKDFGGNTSTVITCTVNVNPDNRTVTFSPSTAIQGRKVTFQANNFGSNNLKWDFGDGISNGGATINHTYSGSGNFTVKATDLNIGLNSFVQTTINVQPDNRSISLNPQNPGLYEEVTFTASNFSSQNIEWDFDRGDTKNNGATVEKHAFKNMGQFTIKAKEAGTDNSYKSINVNIGQDKRRIEFQPPSAAVGRQISIKLVNSNAVKVNWKIGNENPLNNSPKTIQYKFKDPGRFEVTADIQGQTPVRNSLNINDNRSVIIPNKIIFEKSDIKFDARNFNSMNLKWDFGDGVIKTGMKQQVHNYLNPGNFNIKVYDFDGQSKTPVTARVNVKRDNRVIIAGFRTLFRNIDLEFEAKNFVRNNIKWDFGDGVIRMGGKKITHKYSRSGSFQISAVDFGGNDSKKIIKRFNIERDNRTVSAPNQIISGVPFDMDIKNAAGGNFEWKFSDGRTVSGNAMRSAQFSSPGQKVLTIIDRSGKYPPMTKKIMVVPDDRSLKLSSENEIPGGSVKFTAVNFKGTSVVWEFGDGSPPKSGGKIVSHKFSRNGTYRIVAKDFNGKGKKLFVKTVKVADLMPDFKVKAVELNFSNGKYYRIVPKNSFNPGYRVRLKAMGRGLLKGKWLLNGDVLGQFSLVLEDNKIAVLKDRDVPKLPVIDPGVHNITFEFTNYSFSGKVPILRYFVTNSGAVKIIYPLPGSKINKSDEIEVKWRLKNKNYKFEIAVSGIPFQFLEEKQISWQKAGNKNKFRINLDGFNPGDWVYWQVRVVDSSGNIDTASEIASFKVL